MNNPTTVNLHHLTDAEIEKLRNEAKENMAKAYKAGGVMLAVDYWNKLVQLDNYLKARKVAKTYGKM